MIKIAILGCGNMGKALIGGISNAFGSKCSLTVFDLNPVALSGLPESVVIHRFEDWFQNPRDLPDIVILAVKPADIASALKQIGKPELVSKPLWVSIAAGVTISKLSEHLPGESRICRVMPNTPALVGEGMSAFSLNQLCTQNDADTVSAIFNSIGKCVQVPEKLMDAVTGLSGSGPAYVFLFIEALIEGGVTAGLPLPVARECAIQTVIGAAKMVASGSEHPAALKMKVMSPAGTTAQGCKTLEQHGFKHAVISAVGDAAKRSAELGK
ncbi:MAG TPA: pyrroline-5-carboxylate reductase [Chitinispirillaceae bacterium]|nr:pyrroline-5-carboxylate reductase [Chitinispirillaceae bacterium]